MKWAWLLTLNFVVAENVIIFENDDNVTDVRIFIDGMDVPMRERADRLLARAIKRFTLEMESSVASDAPGSNVVFSPFSIASVLGLVLLGSAGVTFDEVAKVLGVYTGIDLTGRSSLVHEELQSVIAKLENQQQLTDSGSYVSTASAVFVQEDYPIRETYVNASKEIYGSEVFAVDFRYNAELGKERINRWVENRTEGHIKDLLSLAPSQDTSVILVSALYFHGEWEHPFYLTSTKVRPYYVGHDEIIYVPMMVNGAEVFYYLDPVRKCTVLGLPYKGREVTFFLVLPDSDIRNFTENLSVSDLEDLANSSFLTTVIFFMPRMKLVSTMNLRPPLEELGILSLFSASKANLTGIGKGLYASDAIHKVEIDITETGTTASAATAISITRDGSNPVVRVERPFLFFIQHAQTGVILFWGTVIRPTPYSDSHTVH